MTPRPVNVVLSTPFSSRCAVGMRKGDDDWDSPRILRYMQALAKEIEANAAQFKDCEVVAMRFGTGVATLAQGPGFERVIRTLRANYHVSKDAPLSTTASISDISGASMPFFRRAGVSRFDFEIMSLDSFDFSRVNKRDNLRDLPFVCDRFLHSYNTNNLGFVLAYGMPNNDVPFRRSILAAVRGHACHIRLRHWNAQAEEHGDGSAESADSKKQLETARSITAENDFEEYAPLCFARAGLNDPCIVAEADTKTEVLGFGVGALTRFDGVESINTSDHETYMEYSHDFTRITSEIRGIS